MRDRAVVARKAHNLEVTGSSPVPATKIYIKVKAFLIIFGLIIISAFAAFASNHITKQTKKIKDPKVKEEDI